MYELAMLAMYGRHYAARYRSISELIPGGSAVLDACCGPALLYHRYLRAKSIRYTGLDINEKFIEQLVSRGGNGKVWDLSSETALPTADYVVMQASLYHFLPDPSPVVTRMQKAARRQVIIAEPIRNLASSRSSLISQVARRLTNPGSGNHSERFNEASLDRFFKPYVASVQQSYVIAGGREKLYVLAGKA
jgi:hypothetical protein